MGTNTLLKDIRRAFAALTAILALCTAGALAQSKVVYNTVAQNGGYICGASGGFRIIDEYDGKVAPMGAGESVFPNLNRAIRPQSIVLCRVDKDGTETMIDSISNSYVGSDGVSNGGLIGPVGANGVVVGYKFLRTLQVYGGTGTNVVGGASKLRYLHIYSQNFDDTELGFTYKLRMNMSRVMTGDPTEEINIYFDAIGAYDNMVLLDPAPKTYHDFDDNYFISPCPGSGDVTLKIANNVTPYRDDDDSQLVSYLGNRYTAVYNWLRSDDTWGRDLKTVKEDSQNYTDSEVTSFSTSGYTWLQPVMTLLVNGSTETGCNVSFANSYYLYYFTPLELTHAFKNLTSNAQKSDTDEFTACFGDDVRYTPTFEQDFDGSGKRVCSAGEVRWTLERLNDDDSVAETLVDESIYYDGEYYDFENLTETARYRVTCEFIDPDGHSRAAVDINGDADGNGIGDGDACPTVKTFTINVRQVSATSEILLPAEACEEDNVEVAAVVGNLPKGDKSADYAYRWFWSDDQISYSDLNTTDYLRSGDALWSDPTDTVKTVYKSITYRFSDDLGPQEKFIKFVLANTYEIDGQVFYCPIPNEEAMVVHKLPILDPIDDVYVCKEQKASFRAFLYDRSIMPEYTTGLGMTYEVFTDEACSKRATEVINLVGEKDRPTAEGDDDTNSNRLDINGHEGAYAWFGLRKVEKDSYTFYVRVKNEQTGCYSHPQEVRIIALPQPQVSSVVPVPDAYCLNADAAKLEVTATVVDEHDGFYSALSRPVPKVTYHWEVIGVRGDTILKQEVYDDGVLKGVFADNKVTAYVGDVLFRVYATDDSSCGYVLDYDGSIASPRQFSNSAEETVVTIHPLPDFTIQEGVKACADQGRVAVELKSNDSRELEFRFEPVGVAPAPEVSTVKVAGASVNHFATIVTVADVADVTTYEYSVKVTDDTSLACDTDAVLRFTAYPVPALIMLPASAGRHLCQGDSIVLGVKASLMENGRSASAADFDYSWTIDGAPVPAGDSFTWTTDYSTPTGLHEIVVVVTYTFADGHVCSSTQSMSVFVDPVPVFDLEKDETICEGESVTLRGFVTNANVANHLGIANVFDHEFVNATDNSSAKGKDDGSGYSWTYTVAPERTTLYRFRPTNTTTGCVSQDFSEVTVSVDRKARVSFTALSESEVCEGRVSIEIGYEVANPDEFGSIDWTTLAVNGFTVSSFDGDKIVVEGDVKAGSVVFDSSSMSATTDKGCDVVFLNSLTLKVNPIPAAPVVQTPADNEVCYHEKENFVFRVQSRQRGYTYEYFFSDAEPAVDATPTATFSWNPGTFTIDGSLLEQTTNIWVRAVDSNNPTACKSAFAGPYTIVVNKTESPTVAPLSEVCQGDKATLTVVAPIAEAGKTYTYHFYGNSDVEQNSANTSYTTKTLDLSAVYYVTATQVETNCTSEVATVNVAVHVKPVGAASVAYQGEDGSAEVTMPVFGTVARSAFCEGEGGRATVTLVAPTLHDASKPWTSELVSVSNGSVADWVKVDEAHYTCDKSVWSQSVTLRFSIGDGVCVSSLFEATVVVEPTLGAPVISCDIAEFCRDDDKAFTFSVTNPSADADVKYVFYAKRQGETLPFLTEGSGDGRYSSSTVAAGIDANSEFYAYAYNTKTGCVSPVSNTVTITVNELPVPTVSATPGVVCPGEEVELKVNEAFAAYEWLDYGVKGQTTQTVTAVPTETENVFNVKVTDAKGCVSKPVPVSVKVFPKPQFTLSVQPDVVCQGSDDKVVFTLTPLNDLASSADSKVEFASEYTFTSSSADKAVQYVGGEYFVDGKTWTEASVTFTATIKSTSAYNSCLSEEESTTVTVIPSLAKPLTDKDDVHVCTGSDEEVTISVANTTAYPTTGGVSYSYHWYTDAAGTQEVVDGADYAVSGSSVTFVPKASTTLYAKVVRETYPKCESELSNVVTITIEPLPDAPVAVDPLYFVCQPEESGKMLNLNVSSPASDFVYHWYVQNDGEVDDDMTDDIEVAMATGSATAKIQAPTETIFLYVRAESKYGCFSADKSNVVKVREGDNPEVVTVTVPNADVCSGDMVSFAVGVSGDNAEVTYIYNRTSSDSMEAPVTGAAIDASGLFAETLTVSETVTYTYEVWARYADHCLSQNSVKFDVTVHGRPTGASQIASSLCENDQFVLLVKNVKSHDLASHSDPANAKLRVVLFASDGTELNQSQVTHGMNANVTYGGGLSHSMLPLYYEIQDLVDVPFVSCPTRKELSFTLVDVPRFALTNKDGKVENVDADGVVEVDYCAGEDMNLAMVGELPTVDADGKPISYVYQWKYAGVNIIGQISTSFSKSGLGVADSGDYELVVKTDNDAACEFSRVVRLTVHELPSPKIEPGNALDIYCADGDIVLKTADDYASYRWVIKGQSDIEVLKSSPDVELRYPIADIAIPDGQDYVDVELYATDVFGCTTVLPDLHSAIVSTPPVITEVLGTETCGQETPFRLGVVTDKANYTVKLFNAAGVELSLAEQVSGAGLVFVTPDTLSEGDYTVRVVDKDSECFSEQAVRLVRYDVSVDYSPVPNRFFCENGVVEIGLEVYDANGHDDFFSHLEDVSYVGVVTNFGYSYSLPAVDISSGKAVVRFEPRQVSPLMAASDVAYTLEGTFSYKLASRADDVLSCVATPAQNFYVMPEPVLVSNPVMPLCLDAEVEFEVKTDNINPAWEKHFQFYVNGVPVVNADGDYSSNVFRVADHPEISLKDWDKVTAEVIMNERGNTCVSDPITVMFNGAFKPVLSNAEPSRSFCKGSDISFSVESVMPDGVDSTFTLSKIKSYELFLVDVEGGDLKLKDYDAVDSLVHVGSFSYSGFSRVVRLYAVVTDENDCVVRTDEVEFKIDQWEIVDVVVSDGARKYATADLCADVDYTYEVKLSVGEGVDTAAELWEYTLTMGGTEWSDPADRTSASVTKSHPKTDGQVELVVDVFNPVTGCKTSLEGVYPSFSKFFSYHEKPQPSEKLKDSLLPVSDDVADSAKFEVCYDDDFGFDVTGDVVTVVYDGVRVATYREGLLEATFSDVLAADRINVSYVAGEAGKPGTTVLIFNIDPSADFHKLSFAVSDDACEVASDDWMFRKFERVFATAVNDAGVDVLDSATGVATICEDDSLVVTPYTSEPSYSKGYNFFLDGVLVSADDFSATSYTFPLSAKGDYELLAVPDFGRNGCHLSVTVKVLEAPKPSVSLGGENGAVTPDSLGVLLWSYSICEEEADTLTLAGAEDYTLLAVNRDGVDVSDDFAEKTFSGLSASLPLSLNHVAGGPSAEYSTYTFTVGFSVGSCEEVGRVVVNVYNKPEVEFINGTPAPLVIAGAQVPVDVTPGYADYKFYVNGALVQEGASNTLDGSLNVVGEGTTLVKVVVYNAFGCSTVLEDRVEVLDGIVAKDVVSSSDFYCSDDEGVKISVVDPQVGVTYVVDGRADLAPILAEEGKEVAWEPVRLAAPAALNPEEFTVMAYYEALSSQLFPMANTVVVEEVQSPAAAFADDVRAIDCALVQSPAFTWTVHNTSLNDSYWLQMEDGTVLAPGADGNGGDLVLPVYDIVVATYGAVPNGNISVVARSKRLNGDWVCDKLLAGTLTVDLPTTTAYEVRMNPGNGNVCADNSTALDIYLSGSDFSSEFEHVYILMRDGVEVDRKTSDAQQGEIHFVDSEQLVAGAYVYSIVCEFSGCRQPMANTVTKTVFDRPTAFKLYAANDGYYCYDDPNEATIVLGGQQEGYKYELKKKGAASVAVQTVIGDASGAEIFFEGVAKGEYYVEVSIPQVEGSACSTIIDEGVVATEIAEPADITPSIAKSGWGGTELTICVGEDYEIRVSGADFDWQDKIVNRSYALYDESGALISDQMVNVDEQNGTLSFPGMTATVAGTFKYTIVATGSVDILSTGGSLDCQKAFEDVLTLTVKERPHSGETLAVDYSPVPENPCYGADIIVNNPNLDVEAEVAYSLYLVDEHGAYVAVAGATIRPYAGDEAKFTNIKDKDARYVVMADNGSCQDVVGEVHISQDKFAKVQVLDFDGYVCLGDPGVPAYMKDSEADVLYELYFISPALYASLVEAGNLSADYLAENVPGVKLSEALATYDHERLVFSGLNYGDGVTTEVVDRDGYYYAVATKNSAPNPCPVASPIANFQTLDLPKSFSLEKSAIYCDPAGSANVYVEQAEYDPNATITYKLYSEDKEGNLTFYDEVSSSPASDGKRLYFTKLVVDGSYVAVAVKEYGAEFGNHVCTSMMRGRIELGYAPALDALVFAEDVNLTLCDGEEATYALDRQALSAALANAQAALPSVKGLYAYLTPVDQPVEGEFTQSIFFDGSADATFTDIPAGQNVVRVSYDGRACIVELGNIFVNRYGNIPTGLRTVACGKEYTLSSAYTVEGVTYELVDSEGTVVRTVTCDPIFSPAVKFDGLDAGDYAIYGSFQGGTLCKVEVGKLSVRGVVASAAGHEVVFCADEPVVYSIPQELLFNDAYYYVTDNRTRPDEYAEELYHYTGGGSLELTNLVDGVNVIWAAFDGYSCLTAVDTVIVTRYPDLPSNVFHESVCGLEYTLDPALLVENATYHFAEKGGVNVADVTYVAGSEVTFVAPAVGEYVVSMTTAEGKCGSSLGTVAFRGGIDASSPIVASVVACGESSVTFDLASDAYKSRLVEGLTYYVVGVGSDPMSEAAFGRKYVAGQKTLFSVAAPGDYKIWASFDNYMCQVEVGSLAVSEVGMEDVELSAVWSCDNLLTFSISPSALGANYELYAVARDKSETLVGSAVAGTGDVLSWPTVAYDASAYRYEVRASAGSCPPLTVAVLYGVSIRQDFDIVAANFYSVGGACSSEPVQLVLDESVAGIRYYLTLDGDDSRTPLVGTEKEGDGSKLVWTAAELPVQTGVVTYRLYAYKGDLATTGCFSGDLWRSVTINFEATTFPVGHLVTKDDILDYCEGDVGVRIGYVETPRKGEVYRLYRKVDDAANPFGAELMDIQEIPSYAAAEPDTLFFDGWGYNESVREYATAGVYFVEVEGAQGCDPVATDAITVVEHQLPGASDDSVYFAIKTKGEVDTTSVSFEYGVINGYIFYQTARPGYTYELVKDDTVTVVSKVVDKEGLLEFGPILETILDSVQVDGVYRPFERIEVVGDTIFSGEGIYSVRVIDNVTSCENTIGGITIVAESLVAYNVQIYLNKNENARTVDLIPLYDYDTDLAHKGNHLYIDWSSKIDRIYRPYVSTSQDGYPYNEEAVSKGITKADHPNFFRYGYANVAGEYKDHSYIGKNGESNVWFNIVDDPDTKVSGTYGFIDVDYQLGIDESIISKSTPAGYFFYMKQPSFYGQEQVQYYIENRQMPGRRSNIATITILCGNEDVGDDEDAVFLVPNAFSPNGDGLNDYFKILIPEKYQDNSESKLEVFNRWGTLVYRSSGLQYGSDGIWWDGTSTTSNMVTLGSNLPSGTYYYVFTITFINKADTQKYERKMHGYVELRR